jgi:GAF domain-containing protein
MSADNPIDSKIRTSKGVVVSRVKTGSEHYAQQLEGLHQIGLEILERVQPDRIIERALELIFPLVDSDGGAFWARKSDQTETWNELILSVGRPSLPLGTRFEEDQGMIGQVFKTGQAVLIDDFMTPEFDGYPVRTSRSLMFVPLKREQAVTGVFVISNKEKIEAFDQNDLAYQQQWLCHEPDNSRRYIRFRSRLFLKMIQIW